jgi:acyl-CoA dehydrogenase
MDFELNEEQRLLLESWRRFVQQKIKPHTQRYLDELIPRELARELLQQSVPFGICGGGVPEQDGGMGLDILTSGLLIEALAQVSPDFAGIAFVTEGVALKMAHGGSPEVRSSYLPRILSGELIAASAVSEPEAGSYVRAIRTKAERDGDAYRITGEKIWTSGIAIADVVIVLTRSGPEEYTIFVVECDQPGVQIREIPTIGLNGWSLGQLTLTDVVVPAGRTIGGIGGGLRETMRGFERARCFMPLLALGISQAALDDSIAYAQQRVQFGRAIGEHQLVQQMVAEMATLLDAARLLVYRGLTFLTQNRRFPVEAAMAKSFATEAAVRITSHAVQVHGAFGISREGRVERYYRSAKMLTIPDGTTQINQLIIGRNLLGLDAFGEVKALPSDLHGTAD